MSHASYLSLKIYHFLLKVLLEVRHAQEEVFKAGQDLKTALQVFPSCRKVGFSVVQHVRSISCILLANILASSVFLLGRKCN